MARDSPSVTTEIRASFRRGQLRRILPMLPLSLIEMNYIPHHNIDGRREDENGRQRDVVRRHEGEDVRDPQGGGSCARTGGTHRPRSACR